MPSLSRFIKLLRNQAWDRYYRSLPSPDTQAVLAAIGQNRHGLVCFTISFNKRWTIDYLTRLWARHVPDATLVVADNSNDVAIAQEIRQLCAERGVAYLKLPTLREKNPNRSHARAINWLYHRIVLPARPAYFGVIDHDNFPVRPIALGQRVAASKVYGMHNGMRDSTCWNIWAGYSFHQTAHLAGKPVDFHPAHHLGLDTGGANWHGVYARTDEADVTRVDCRFLNVSQGSVTCEIAYMDEAFLHIGGVSYSAMRSAMDLSMVQHHLDLALTGQWDIPEPKPGELTQRLPNHREREQDVKQTSV